MKYYLIQGRIDNEAVDKFMAFCNSNSGDHWTIAICSTGGNTNAGRIIVRMINDYKDRVTLISSGVYSNAFYIFSKAECKKVLTEESIGMWHLSSADMKIRSDMQRVYADDDCIVKNWKESSAKSDLTFAESFMNKKEIKDYKAGKEVYFTFNRMKEIFPDAEVI